MIANEALQRLLARIAPQVCCIVGDVGAEPDSIPRLGTGFLVGPDLILTAMHVLDPMLMQDRQGDVPGRFYAVFDFESGGPITGLRSLTELRNVRIVSFHEDWHRRGSAKVSWVSDVAAPDDQQLQELAQGLDFVLIRLADDVGRQLMPGTNEIRGWISTDDPDRHSFSRDSRMIIPQHPFGMPRTFDFGRIDRFYPGETRVISEIETEQGTSGAPCFNNRMKLLGLHSASYRPNGPVDGNIAVCFNKILPIILQDLPNAPNRAEQPEPMPPGQGINLSNGSTAQRDNIPNGVIRAIPNPGPATSASTLSNSPDGTPVSGGLVEHSGASPSKTRVAKKIWRTKRSDRQLAPVLGREKLQAWLDIALNPPSSGRSRSDRVYVADAPQSGSGKTFTTDIVRTVVPPDQKQNVIVLGGNTEFIPMKLEDFVLVLAAGFGLYGDQLGPLPPRPGTDLPKEARDGDKLDRWESQDMPEWFVRQLAAYRTTEVNKTEALKRIVDNNIALGRPNTAEDLAAANADPPEMIVSLKWTRAWILLDDLDQRPLSAEVRKFVAGLIGSDIDESAVTDLRADLQWLFLGTTPEFLVASDMTVEIFSPGEVKVEHIAATIRAAFDQAGIQEDSDSFARAVGFLIPKALRDEHDKGNLDQTPLSVCQQLTADFISGTYNKFGRTL